MRDFGPQTLFLQNAYVHLAIAAAALWSRMTSRRPKGLKQSNGRG